MALARHDAGGIADLRALASQVHPVFMLPPLAASWFGAVLAGEFALGVGTLHMLAAFLAVYTAHVKDGYVDYHRRREDDDHPMTARGCRLALAGSTAGFAVVLVAIGVLAGPVAAAVTLPLWVIGYFHAPQLDTTTLGATLGYPAGIALAIVGGHVVQTGGVTPTVLGFAAVFLVVLTGVKVVDDESDHDYDRSIDKRTVAVVLGLTGARQFAYLLFLFGGVLVLWLTVAGVFPPSAPAAPLVFWFVALLARRAPSDLATMLLVRGTYLFLALLVVSAWYRPLDPVGLPDITVFGPYTYLVTEVAFGALALGLLRYADALRSAARTVVTLYPLAYVWDWYTLEVGVFEIVTRTGYDLFGIPIEEHLFMIVIPALVVGVHETLRTLDEKSETGDESNDEADGEMGGEAGEESNDERHV